MRIALANPNAKGVEHMNSITRFINEESGQSTVEYMLLISVIVIAIVAAAYVFIDPFKEGVQALATDVQEALTNGVIGDDIAGTARH